jgi:hypothetical protein
MTAQCKRLQLKTIFRGELSAFPQLLIRAGLGKRRQNASLRPARPFGFAQGRLTRSAVATEKPSENLWDQSLVAQEFVRYVFRVAVLAVESVIQLLHLLIGDLSA